MMRRDVRHAPLELALKQRKFEDAHRLARSLLKTQPDDAEALRLLGAALSGLGKGGDAMVAIRRAIALRPDDPRTHNSLGAALHAIGDREGANAAFARAVEVAPDFVPAWHNLATGLMMQEDNAGALHAIGNLLRLEPGSLRAKIMRTDVLRNTRPGAEVAAEYRCLIDEYPGSGWPWFGYSNLKSVPFTAADVAQMRNLREKIADARERISLTFALAKALEDVGNFEEAYAALSEANAGVRRNVAWNAAGFSHAVAEILGAFPVTQTAPPTQGREAIFIVGLPRSGTTLVEQILCSHTYVVGGGEMDHLAQTILGENRRRGEPLAQWAAKVAGADWERLGSEYLRKTAVRRGAALCVTDKAPENWTYAGAALAMLPRARIINCRRDPVEVGFSCYKQLFSADKQAFSYDIGDIAAYWRDYDRACQRWRELYLGRFLDVRYEDVQANLDSQVRRLLDFCGLEFEPACVRFHENARAVNTVSAAQVREPMRRDTARAHKYGALLDPLRAALGQPRQDAS
ncbi:MAG: sulfotransferase [Rudaea sp.]